MSDVGDGNSNFHWKAGMLPLARLPSRCVPAVQAPAFTSEELSAETPVRKAGWSAVILSGEGGVLGAQLGRVTAHTIARGWSGIPAQRGFSRSVLCASPTSSHRTSRAEIGPNSQFLLLHRGHS